MRLYGLLGGGQVCICVQCVQEARGVRGHVPPGNLILDLLLDAIWWNLGPFSYNIIYHLCVIKAFIKA